MVLWSPPHSGPASSTLLRFTLEAIVRVESGGQSVRPQCEPPPRPAASTSDVAEAVSLAQGHIARGYSVDLGLMQANNRNLATLGYTIEQVLDPCSNIRGGAAILTAHYAMAVRVRGEGQGALKGSAQCP